MKHHKSKGDYLPFSNEKNLEQEEAENNITGSDDTLSRPKNEHNENSSFSNDEDNVLRPLAARLAPKNFDEFVGQEHILAPGKFLRKAIETGRLGSAIFFGPPGSGKTACARLAARYTRARFVQINAVTAGVADLREIIREAKFYLENKKQQTILLVDEIHHFNRTQQDALLPDVERGNVILIGITTENPYFYINSALVSRANVFEFKPLSKENLKKILHFAVENLKRDYGYKKIEISADAEEHLVLYSSGDARRLLNAVELALLGSIKSSGAKAVAPRDNDVIRIDISAASEAIQRRPILYDKSSDSHYDHISAFIKSMRGSDPDAAIYWMVKMLEAGEDPRFIIRRVLIQAAEDVGMADPHALVVAAAALEAIEFVGMPEAAIPLAEAVIYVSTAPKSNTAYLALEKARKEVRAGPQQEVPIHLKDTSLDGEKLGHGKGYKYPHDFPYGFVKQEYMPFPKIFYEPKEIGFEREIKKRLVFLQGLKKNLSSKVSGNSNDDESKESQRTKSALEEKDRGNNK